MANRAQLLDRSTGSWDKDYVGSELLGHAGDSDRNLIRRHSDSAAERHGKCALRTSVVKNGVAEHVLCVVGRTG
jgi:hypothetical protein